MTTLQQAVELARIDQEQGHILRFVIDDGCLDVETDQGWRQARPNDPDPDNYPD